MPVSSKFDARGNGLIGEAEHAVNDRVFAHPLHVHDNATARVGELRNLASAAVLQRGMPAGMVKGPDAFCPLYLRRTAAYAMLPEADISYLAGRASA